MAYGLQTYTAMCNPLQPDTLEDILHEIDPVFDDYDVELFPLAAIPGVSNCRHALIAEKKPAPQDRYNITFDHQPKEQCAEASVKAIRQAAKELKRGSIPKPISPGNLLEQILALLS